MEHCEFWWKNDQTEQCDLVNDVCKCSGCSEHCSIKGQSIVDALRKEEKITLEEASERSLRRRRWMREVG